MSPDKDVDFLRLALPDEIATTLSYVAFLIHPSLRHHQQVQLSQPGPGTSGARDAGDADRHRSLPKGRRPASDHSRSSRCREQSHSVAGHAQRRGLGHDRHAGTDSGESPPRPGSCPGAGDNSAEAATHPKNEEAYDLYLRSVSLPHEAPPIKKRSHAGARRRSGFHLRARMAALGERYYYDSHYSDGGGAIFSDRLQPMSERWLSIRTSVTLPANSSPIGWREVSWERLTRTRRPWWKGIPRTRRPT